MSKRLDHSSGSSRVETFSSFLPSSNSISTRPPLPDAPEYIIVFSDWSLSDVDVAVFLDPEFLDRQLPEYPYGYKAHLISELMSQLGTNQIDVLILNHAGPFMRFQVLHQGIVICETDHEERIRFQALALSRYFDLKPFLKAGLPAKIFG